jgi:hypothetical protein
MKEAKKALSARPIATLILLFLGIGFVTYSAVKMHATSIPTVPMEAATPPSIPPFPVKHIRPDMSREEEEIRVSVDRRTWETPPSFNLTDFRYFRVYHRELDQELIYWVGDLRWCDEEPAKEQSFYSYLTDAYCYDKGHNHAILGSDMTCDNCIRPIRR